MAVDLRAREAAASATLRSIDIIADAGATGADLAGDALDGVEVLVWGDAWEKIGDGAAARDEASDVSVRIDDAARLTRIAKDRLVVAVAAAAPSGAGPPAALTLEGLEVTVRYREE